MHECPCCASMCFFIALASQHSVEHAANDQSHTHGVRFSNTIVTAWEPSGAPMSGSVTFPVSVCMAMINEAAAKMEAIRREEEERCRKQTPPPSPPKLPVIKIGESYTIHQWMPK